MGLLQAWPLIFIYYKQEWEREQKPEEDQHTEKQSHSDNADCMRMSNGTTRIDKTDESH